MADRLRLRVYSPERELVDTETTEVIAPSVRGEIGILPDHAGLVTMLEAGTITFKDAGKPVRVRITGGFAEVRDNVVTVLADGGDLQR